MNEIDKVMEGLRCCIESDKTCECPERCPYGAAMLEDCEMTLKQDALAVIETLTEGLE